MRLGTASMLSQSDGPFINLARLNIGQNKHAELVNVGKKVVGVESLFKTILKNFIFAVVKS